MGARGILRAVHSFPIYPPSRGWNDAVGWNDAITCLIFFFSILGSLLSLAQVYSPQFQKSQLPKFQRTFGILYNLSASLDWEIGKLGLEEKQTSLVLSIRNVWRTFGVLYSPSANLDWKIGKLGL